MSDFIEFKLIVLKIVDRAYLLSLKKEKNTKRKERKSTSIRCFKFYQPPLPPLDEEPLREEPLLLELLPEDDLLLEDDDLPTELRLLELEEDLP